MFTVILLVYIPLRLKRYHFKITISKYINLFSGVARLVPLGVHYSNTSFHCSYITK